MLKPPAVSTIHEILNRNGLVKRRNASRRDRSSTGSPRGSLEVGTAPFVFATIDFFGSCRAGIVEQRAQSMKYPPLTSVTSPVTQSAAMKYTTALATSAPTPGRASG